MINFNFNLTKIFQISIDRTTRGSSPIHSGITSFESVRDFITVRKNFMFKN